MSMGLLIKLEYAALAALAVFAYYLLGGNWQMFILLVLLPDISMLGYLSGPKAGAIAYNLAHNWIIVAAVMIFGVVSAQITFVLVALIWAFHIAGDRALGYGLKYETGFRDTHLGRIGKE